jgi:hypothetical protein
MALLCPNAAEEVILSNFLNKVAPQDLVLKLYKNDKTPADGDDEGDYTEATFSGYADADLTGANWTITPGAPSEAVYPQQTFTSDANQTTENIYGYFVVQTTSGKIMWAERFPNGPYPISNAGDAIKVTPKIQLKKSGE